jgi:hypothetical protein
VKDFGMVCLYDDRCKQVMPNTGVLVEDILCESEKELYAQMHLGDR